MRPRPVDNIEVITSCESSLACFSVGVAITHPIKSVAHVSKSIHSAIQNCAALNFLILFIELFEHELINTIYFRIFFV